MISKIFGLAGTVLLAFVLTSSCVDEGARRSKCRELCVDDASLRCVDATDVRACTDACETVSESYVQDFNSCASDAFFCEEVAACFGLIDVRAKTTAPGESFDRRRCRDSCSDLNACSTSSESSDCLEACDTVAVSSAETFANCTFGSGKPCMEKKQCLVALGL